MQKAFSFLALGGLSPLMFGLVEATASQTDIVTLAPFLVADSKAGVFCVRLSRGDLPRIWFVNLDPSTRRSASLPVQNNTELHLVPLRSYTLRSGDEIVSIGGKPVSAMTGGDALRGLLSHSNPQPVSVQVRAPGAQREREATFVLQSAVRAGTRVPKNN